MFNIALGVTSDGVATPPVRFAFTVPAAIVARYELVMLCVGRFIVTAPEIVVDVSGELAVTDEMPGAGYVEATYAPICAVVILTEAPDWTASSCSEPLSAVADGKFGICETLMSTALSAERSCYYMASPDRCHPAH